MIYVTTRRWRVCCTRTPSLLVEDDVKDTRVDLVSDCTRTRWQRQRALTLGVDHFMDGYNPTTHMLKMKIAMSCIKAFHTCQWSWCICSVYSNSDSSATTAAGVPREAGAPAGKILAREGVSVLCGPYREEDSKAADQVSKATNAIANIVRGGASDSCE